ncbi:hypothetical protein OS175_07535 [Marinicella sp. S1101]|uniref:hypothetical protein n=1 Tax=Marinicella marina TaxID=2996016 RepID=UPI002260AEF5|nr:hypothetical protein [Marinicella marina]MCX7553726.1 hypothetical protein [Marinicella marina]
MKTLNVKLDNAKSDVESITRYLNGYDASIAIYNGDFTSDWLLSDIHDPKWLIRTNKTVKSGDGYKYVKTINWDRVLADSSRLTDNKNVLVLHTVQKLLFISCESQVVFSAVGQSSLQNIFNELMKLISWGFREDVHLNIEKDFLYNLTQARLKDYITDSAIGGIFKSSGMDQLFRSELSKRIGTPIVSKNMLKISEEEVFKISNYFLDNGYYSENSKGLKYIDRKKICKKFKAIESLYKLDTFSLFLRQFEPDYLKLNHQVLLPLTPESEFPGHTTPLIDDIHSSKPKARCLKKIINVFSELLKTKPLFDKALPDPNQFRLGELSMYAKRLGVSHDTTPWVPLPIVLSSLNYATDMVLNNGDSILSSLESLYLLLDRKALKGTLEGKKLEERRKIVDRFLKKNFKEFNVRELRREGRLSYNDVFDELRSNPTLGQLLEILRASCFIIISALKPIRVNELCSLKYDCLHFKKNDGYWLKQNILKSGINGQTQEDFKPIPVLAAKAIKVLQHFNRIAKRYGTYDQGEEEFLLFTTKIGKSMEVANISHFDAVRRAITIFSDYFEMPKDEYGRRWYINIHEFRKSFLLTYFWTFKFSGLDSARWIAGHTHSDHIFNYIEANFVGEEMVEVEAEYAYQQLRLFNRDNSLSDIQNIEELNDDVCRHFNVKVVSELSSDELLDWISYSIEEGNYEIFAYGIDIGKHDNFDSAKVAFKINKGGSHVR